jgi:predicted enzyme related to lactoylglutathione lyase
MTEAGIAISIMADDAEATKKLIRDNGGKIVYSNKLDSGETIVQFTDPAGNIMGLYQPNH